MSFLGFDALGKLALGQLPQRFSNFFFSLWPQPQTKKSVPESFKSFIFVPVTTPVVFSSFSQPSSVKIQQPSQGFVVPVLGTVTPSSLVFTKFSEPSFSKVRQQSNTNSSFFIQPAAAVVIVGGDFSDFDLIQSKKNLPQGFTNFVFIPPTATPVFTKFEQPQTKRVLQQNQSFVSLQVTPVVVQPVFSRFEQPSVKRILQVDSSFINLPVVTVVQQPYVFGQFSQPLSKRIQQADSSFVNLPVVITPVVNFTGFVDSIPQQKRFNDGFITAVNPRTIQPYVFSSFSQPQPKDQINDQPTWFTSLSISQPYVFSSFSQPFGVRSQEYLHQFTQSVLYPTIIISVPNFTGFNDFGLTQQTVGSQNRQDASSVQFQILPMPQIISDYQFTGFSDFGLLIPGMSNRQHGLIDFPNSPFIIIIPPIPPEEVTGGGKRWRYPKVHKVRSSNIDKIAYDPESRNLAVKFKTEKVYNYADIDPKQVKELRKSKSPGGYLFSNIIGKHTTTKVK